MWRHLPLNVPFNYKQLKGPIVPSTRKKARGGGGQVWSDKVKNGATQRPLRCCGDNKNTVEEVIGLGLIWSPDRLGTTKVICPLL